MKFNKTIMIGVVATIATFFSFTTINNSPQAQSLFQSRVETTVDTYQNLQLFSEIFNHIRENYVDGTNLTDTQLIDAAIKGMLSKLDRHSRYLNPEQAVSITEHNTGRFQGIGAQVKQNEENGLIEVVIPIDGSPAKTAGILKGDFIKAVNGDLIIGMDLRDAVNKIKGPPGSEVVLTIIRDDEELEITVIRGNIESPTVNAWMLDGNIVFIRLYSFNGISARKMSIEILRLKNSIGEGETLNGFILDLRNNPGGLLREAVEITDMFVNGGRIVYTKSRWEDEGSMYVARAVSIIPMDVPMVVLINNGSASASEVVASALRDLDRALLVGEISFGKGSVQTVIPLFNGGVFKLTTAKYFSDSGFVIDGVGLTPDFTITLPEDYVREDSKEIDDQMQKAIDVIVLELRPVIINPM